MQPSLSTGLPLWQPTALPRVSSVAVPSACLGLSQQLEATPPRETRERPPLAVLKEETEIEAHASFY